VHTYPAFIEPIAATEHKNTKPTAIGYRLMHHFLPLFPTICHFTEKGKRGQVD
jgi:hypothetical protein